MRLIEKFCEAKCLVQLVPDINTMPSTEKFCRKAAADWQACSTLTCRVLVQTHPNESRQVNPDELHFVAVTDFTKLGAVSQQEINQHAQWMANILAKNPLRTSVS